VNLVAFSQILCCAAPAPCGTPPDGSHSRLGLQLSRDLPATAVSAYANAVPLPRTAQDVDSTPAVASPKPQARPTSQPRAPVAKVAGHLQAQQHVLHPETAYTFVAPNWEPLIGRSRQHQRVEREVRGCQSCVGVAQVIQQNIRRSCKAWHTTHLLLTVYMPLDQAGPSYIALLKAQSVQH
jgi:hypothetical protein